MGLKHAGALLALTAVCTPAAAFDGVQTIFYVRIPLAAQAAPLSFGMRLQGGREQEAIDIDERMLHLLPAGGAGAGAGWLLAGAVLVGAAVAMNGDRRAQQRAEQQASAAAPPPPCPENCK